MAKGILSRRATLCLAACAAGAVALLLWAFPVRDGGAADAVRAAASATFADGGLVSALLIAATGAAVAGNRHPQHSAPATHQPLAASPRESEPAADAPARTGTPAREGDRPTESRGDDARRSLPANDRLPAAPPTATAPRGPPSAC